MWKGKKFIIIVVSVALVLAGSITGVALAQTETSEDSQINTLYDRVADILLAEGVNVTSDQLKDAFAQAQSDIRDQALQDRLQSLVEAGKLSQEEADKYFEWWQAKPDVPAGFGFRIMGGFAGMRGMRGMDKMHGFGGFCAPANEQ
jgi:hypothetical protein